MKNSVPNAASLDVLIIEDDELTSTRLELLTEQCGHGALSAHSIVQARQAMAAVYFPILIVDRMLGDGDGIDLCREYRKRHPDNGVYIIMLSALDSQDDIDAGMAAGADDYLSKRASDEEFILRLKIAAQKMHVSPKNR